MCWLARKKKGPRLKGWDVHANTANSAPVLPSDCFPQGIPAFTCGVCQVFRNALEPLTTLGGLLILLDTLISTFAPYVQIKMSCVRIGPNISENVRSLK